MTMYRRFLSAMIAALLALMILPAALGEVSDYDVNAPQNLRSEHLFAESALLVDEDTGEVLFSKNSRVRMYPASTTKIMTLLLALESGIPLDSQVTIPAEAADVPEGSSVIPVKPGDVMSFSDLLYGFMLSSGNDGANAIAVLVDGGIAPFVERMNRRAAELGCEGTHYVNAHGYHDAEHYTTAQDLALISRAAMENADFRRIVAAPKWTMTILREGKETSLEIVSRNTLLQSGEKYYYPDCTGIKTGHHNKAGWCFVGSAQRDGMRVICVVLGCEAEMSKWYDAARLFEYGFTRYERVSAGRLLDLARRRHYSNLSVENADPADSRGGIIDLDLSVGGGGDVTVPVVAGSESALNAAADRLVSVRWKGDIFAPVAEGDVVGTLVLETEGTAVEAALTAARSVAAKPAATATPGPTPTALASGDGGAASANRNDATAARGGSLWIVVLLIALLAAAAVALALAAQRARARRERERRRRRRARSAASRGTAPASRTVRRSAGSAPTRGSARRDPGR